MSKVILINGNNKIDSRLTGVQSVIEQSFQKQRVQTEVIYVHQLPANDLIRVNFNSEILQRELKKVVEADVIVLLTPIYKASYTGILKTFIDLIPQKGFEEKIVWPVAIGGTAHHLLAIDYTLKPLAITLGATQIAKSVFVQEQQVIKVDALVYNVDLKIQARLAQEVERITDQLIQKEEAIQQNV